MVYFIISRVGFNCGFDNNQCPKYPNFCMQCVQNSLEKLGMQIQPNIKITNMDSDEKRLEMYRENIWQKFLDVLNIKRIVLLDKISGVPILDYPISGADFDVGLLTGFIQANITFSESGEDHGSDIAITSQFYEFQYSDFNIILKEGGFIRACLILDSKASGNLRKLIIQFLMKYELTFLKKLVNFKKTKFCNFEDTVDFITDIFNLTFVFPMSLSQTIPPHVLEEIEKSKIQSSIIKFSQEILASKPFFFLFNLLNKVQSVVNLEANVILYEIYLLLEKNIIVPTTLATAEDEIKTFKETRARRVASNEAISSFLVSESDALNELREQAQMLDATSAKKMMMAFVKKGKVAEKGLIYNEAQKEYQKALFVATGFEFNKDIGKISFMILELDKKMMKLELDFELQAAEKAEKRKSFIDAISHYQKAVKILEDDVNSSDIESKIKKFNKKIAKLQANL